VCSPIASTNCLPASPARAKPMRVKSSVRRMVRRA
jgi:hypothetical protein